MHCERLHADHLIPAMDDFRNTTTLVAVRVGVGSNRAIIIKDRDGTIRQTTRVGSSTVAAPSNDQVTAFLNVALALLRTDPNPDKGKITFSTLVGSRLYDFAAKYNKQTL